MRLLLILTLSQLGSACNVTRERDSFDPACLPASIRNFSDIGQQKPPYKYLQWMLAQTCGLPVAELATRLATLPQVISSGLRGVFMLWSIYILGNFMAVGAMSLFQMSPPATRCCGFFKERSYDYKKVVGPLYYALFATSVVIAVGMTWRFFREVHAYRQLLRSVGAGHGQGCIFVLGLRWMSYRHCFDLLLLMIFTGVDLILLLAELSWMCLLHFLSFCRCFFCSFWKGCCGICGYCCCNAISSLCCLVPLAGVVLYFLLGMAGTALVGMACLVLFSAALLSFTWLLRSFVQCISCHFCKALTPASFYDMVLLLYPFPPGSPFFTTAAAVRRPITEQEAENDARIRKTPASNTLEVEQAHLLSTNYLVWQDHLGVPQNWISFGFPAWWSMVGAPALLLTVAVVAVLNSNALLLSEAMAKSDLSWLPAHPTDTWSYHWCVVSAVCQGITDAFHGVFVEVPLHIFTHPGLTWRRFWGSADRGSDFLNLFAKDRLHPESDLVAGQFQGNFHTFRCTVLLLRLLLTMLFTCLRLTAVIARTEEEDEELTVFTDSEDFEDVICQ